MKKLHVGRSIQQQSRKYRAKMVKSKKRWLVYGLVFGSLLFSSAMPVTDVHASGWSANTVEQIIERIDHKTNSITMIEGDTVWNIGLAINIKNPMQLLYDNGFKDGDQYTLQVGTVISWDGNRVTVKDPSGKIIGDKIVSDEEKFEPEKTVANQASDIPSKPVQTDKNGYVKQSPSAASSGNKKTSPSSSSRASTTTKNNARTSKSHATTAKKTTKKTTSPSKSANQSPKTTTPSTKKNSSSINHKPSKQKPIHKPSESTNIIETSSSIDSTSTTETSSSTDSTSTTETSSSTDSTSTTETSSSTDSTSITETSSSTDSTSTTETSSSSTDSTSTTETSSSTDSTSTTDTSSATETSEPTIPEEPTDPELPSDLPSLITALEVAQEEVKTKEIALTEAKERLAEILANQPNLTALEQIVAEKQAEVDRLQEKLAETPETMIPDHRQEIAELQKSLTTKEAALVTSNEKLAELKAAIQQAETSYATGAAQVKDAKEQWEQYQEEHPTVSEVPKEITDLENAGKEKMTAAETQKKEAEEQVSTIEKMIASLQTEITTLKEKITALTNAKPIDNPAYAEVVAALADASTQLTTAKQTLNEAQEYAETSIQPAQEALTNAENALQRAREKVAVIEKAIAAEQARLLERAKQTAIANLENLNLRADEKNAFISRINEQTDVEAIAGIVTEAQATSAKNDQIDAENKEKEEAARKLQAEKEQALARLDTLNLKNQQADFITRIQEVTAISQIEPIITEAEELSTQNDKKDEEQAEAARKLQQAKEQAIETIQGLAVTNSEIFITQVNAATTETAIEAIVKAAQAQAVKEAEEQEKLASAKKQAITTIKDLQLKEEQPFIDQVNAAKTEQAINDIIKAAQEQAKAEEKTDAEKQIDAIKSEHMDGLNAYRTVNELNRVGAKEIVQYAADIRAREIADLFEHTRPNGTSFSTAFDEAKTALNNDENYRTIGENIALFTGEADLEAHVVAETLLDLWKNSPPHNANMLNANYTHAAFSVYYDEQEGVWYGVQLFWGDF